MTTLMQDVEIQHDVPIPTWFGVGGGASRFVRARTEAQLERCLEIDPSLRMLGDGANLLVDDDGVSELVVSVAGGELAATRILTNGWVHAGAGADLPRLVLDTVRMGLAGLEGLGGIPATVGGAVLMNAGGAYGQISDAIQRVHVIDRAGRTRELQRSDIAFGYRTSGLNEFIITGAEFRLTPSAPSAVRERLKEVMAYKKRTQPMGERSAGCAFKNPTIGEALFLEGLDPFAPGSRVSAGLLIDRAGCKGLRIGSAVVSERHANFLTAEVGGRARDVIVLMGEVQRRVHDAFGVRLQREVVVWSR